MYSYAPDNFPISVAKCPTCQCPLFANSTHICSGVKVEKKFERPPLGIIPRKIWKEQRFEELKEAMLRYVADFRTIPPEWIEEYNDFVRGGE